MAAVPGFVELIGNTPLIRLHGPSEATGCEILGKCEFLNPGGSVKDRAALYIVRDAERRGRAETRRDHRRRHRRQHRHRACAGGQLPRLPLGDRDSRDPEPGKEGHAAALRRGADPGAGGPLSRPQQLREVFRTPRRRDCREGAERRGLGQPVRQRGQPPGPCRDDGARDLGPDLGARSTASSAPSAPAARSPGSAWRSRSASPRS